MNSVLICSNGARTRAVRTIGGFRLDVLDPDPLASEDARRVLASFDCPLPALLAAARGKPYHTVQGGKSLQITLDGPVVEVRYGPEGERGDACEVLRRDYLSAFMELVKA